jgi:hypothetical protein
LPLPQTGLGLRDLPDLSAGAQTKSAYSPALYPYFVCLGWCTRHIDCRQKAVLIEGVEQAVVDLYQHI